MSSVSEPSLRIVQGDARKLDLPDGSVNMIATSPPYADQRRYEDDGKPVEGQIGAEGDPQAYLENLWDCLREWWRVLAPDGSVFVNLGDKRAASGAPGTTSGLGVQPQGERTGIAVAYGRSYFGRPKSRQMLPERFAIGCMDGRADPESKGWIVRQVIVWAKTNGIPESVGDRSRDDYELIYHLTKEGDYYSAVDELRGRPGRSASKAELRGDRPYSTAIGRWAANGSGAHPLGRLPGSVWWIATDPLTIPAWAKAKYDLPDHFAAWPSAIPRRLILGWSPPAICLECGEGRWPVVDRRRMLDGNLLSTHARFGPNGQCNEAAGPGHWRYETKAAILGYACRCTPSHVESERSLTHVAEGCDGTELFPTGEVDIFGDDRLEERTCTNPEHYQEEVKEVQVYDLDGWTSPPDHRALILDPFSGTGTTLLTAKALGRDSIGYDLSVGYCRLAEWRCSDTRTAAKVRAKTYGEAQGVLL